MAHSKPRPKSQAEVNAEAGAVVPTKTNNEADITKVRQVVKGMEVPLQEARVQGQEATQSATQMASALLDLNKLLSGKNAPFLNAENTKKLLQQLQEGGEKVLKNLHGQRAELTKVEQLVEEAQQTFTMRKK